MSTTLDSDVTKPSVTEPGDGPADTLDPTEEATSVSPQPGEEAIKVGTVNAVVVTPKPARKAASKAKDRFEEYEATKPNGDVVTVKRNLETGETTVS